MPVTNVSFSPDGSIIAVGEYSEEVTVWHAKDGSELVQFPGSPGDVLTVSFSPDGRFLSGGANSAS